MFENTGIANKVPCTPDAGGPSSSGCTRRGSPAHATAQTSLWTVAVGAHGTTPCTPVPTSVAPSHGKLHMCCFLWYPSTEGKYPHSMSLSQIDLCFGKISILPELPSQAFCKGCAQSVSWKSFTLPFSGDS